MKFRMVELIGTETDTARLGSSDEAAGRLNDKDAGKIVKFVGDSRYDLAASGDEIEGRIVSVDTATSDGYSTGAVQKNGRIMAVVEGGALAVKDYVVCGTPVAKGVAQPDAGPKVIKAPDQAVAKASPFAWRVVSLGAAGTGAVGTQVCIEKA
jgi:hypothetical protein